MEKYMLSLLNDTNFDDEISDPNHPVFIVKMGATWCGPCHAIEPTLNEISKDYEERGVKVYNVDVDQSEMLAQKYTIRSIPTLLFINNGKVVEKTVGMQTKEKITNILDKILSA